LADSGKFKYDLMPEGTPFESGFSAKIIWGALFVGFVMLPGAIYLGLVSGQSLGGAAHWVTIILFVEIAKRTFIKLKPQELLILYWVSGTLVMMGGKLGMGANLFGGPFGNLIWDQYLIQSPQARDLAVHIPSWLVPNPFAADDPSTVMEALAGRSFLHKAWIIPITLLCGHIVLHRILDMALGYSLFRVTSDIERLPFPMAPVRVGGAMALAETSNKEEGWRWRVFSIGAVIGLLFGSVYICVPTLTNIFMTKTVQFLPIPFADFTTNIQSYFPASPLAFGTDLALFFTGFVLPWRIVLGSFIAYMSVVLAINPMLFKAGILHSWTPGMTALPTKIANSLDFWLSFTIGAALVIFFLGLGAAVRAAIRKRKADASAVNVDEESGLADDAGRYIPDPNRGDIPVPLALLIWGAATLGYVLLVRFLVPDFPWWITAVFGFIWTPAMSYIGARLMGITGSGHGGNIPYLREGSFYLSGYKGADIWFAPIPMFNVTNSVMIFKEMELAKTKFSSYVKMTIVATLVMLACSFLFWEMIWRLGPIPSAAYPYVNKMWPFHAVFQCFWASSTLPGASSVMADVINPHYIGAGFGVAVVLCLFFTLTGIHMQFFYAFISGLASMPYEIIPMFLGGVVGRYYFRKKFGAEKWRAYTPIVLAGYSCGMGLIAMCAIAVTLIYKAISQLVY
jgi:hypothetical protein